MNFNEETILALSKAGIAWFGIVIGHAVSGVTLSGLALFMTIAFSASQMWWGWKRYLKENHK